MKISDKIKDSKSNLKLSDRLNVTFQLYKYYQLLLEGKNDEYLLNIVIVNIVSANESFFKETLAALFDFDPIYVEKSKQILKRTGSKIDIEDFLNVTKSHFTLGDLIAFSLKYSSIESILKNFKELTNIDFLNCIETLESELIESDFDYLCNPSRPINKNRIISNLKEIYEYRNVICHDFLSSTHKLKLEYGKVLDYILDSLLLQEAITILLSDKIYSLKIPLEENDIKEKCLKEIKECEQELNLFYDEIRNTFHSNKQLLKFEQNEKMFNQFLKSDSQDFGFWFNDSDETYPFQSEIYEHKLIILRQRIEFFKKRFE